jgi:hypothetical protein
LTQQTVIRCLQRAAELGLIAALDDRPPAGRDPVITAEAKTWLVALACRKANGWVIPTSCGPPGGSPRMPGNMGRTCSVF